MKKLRSVFNLFLLLVMVITIGSVATAPAAAAPLAVSIGNITNFSASGNTYAITAGTAQVRVIFYKHDIFRIWLAPNGSFTDPVGSEIATTAGFPAITTTWSDAGTYYKMESNLVVLRANKSPLTFALYKKDNTTLIWQESVPLNWTASAATQNLVRGATEQFYGGGMQNGFFSHRDRTIAIVKDNNWVSGGHANPSPFYLSTAGYGVYRNTWSTGSYNFTSAGVATTHNESRFDAYYFYGPSLKQVLGGYTALTGTSPLSPIWGMELGNADCWNTSNPSYTGTKNKPGKSVTTDVIAFAQAFRDNDMPGGWFLPNDGYGCGYSNLTTVVTQLKNRGFYTGLWTQSGVANCVTEIGTSGTRGIKTDVAWVGAGYKFALDAVKTAAGCIENNSTGRTYIWSVDGWAGTQKYSGVWTGDQSGSWENIRFHIPTYLGTGLSGQNNVGSDVDGIYTGSSATYIRDLEWKSFTQMLMTMSGWSAEENKQPYQYPEPYKSYNRKYLKLRERLLPYFYTYSREAYDTGVPLVRAMVLEFPNDSVTWGTTTQYQFMSGESLLVAPVYQNATTRSGIYFPAGKWIDYWDGTIYNGPQTLNNYPAPIDKLPLFVKAGAIIPMWPQMLYWEQLPKDPITFDIYPNGNTSFTLYEDDGLTRNYKTGSFAKQTITSNQATNTYTIGASNGSFTGKQASRKYLLDIHTSVAPTVVLRDSATLTQYASQSALDAATEGWYFNASDRGGVLHVKTISMSTGASFQIRLTNGPTPTPTFGPSQTPTNTPLPTNTSTNTPAPVAGALNNVRYFPRAGQAARMLGGKFQGSNTSATSGFVDLATINTTPVNGQWATLNFSNSIVYRYVRYLSPTNGWGNVAELEFYAGATRLTGTGFGTAGSYNNAGNTFNKALDGNTSTAFDGPTANGVYVGIDTGASGPTATPTRTNTPVGPTATLTNTSTPTATPSSGGVIPQAGWVATCDSQETSAEQSQCSKSIDGSASTIWHTQYSGTVASLPHQIVINMGASYNVTGLKYLPRQVGTNGNIGLYEIYVSADGVNWGTAVASGTFADNQTEKTVTFAGKTGQYIRFRALSEAGNTGQWTTAAEINVFGSAVAALLEQPPTETETPTPIGTSTETPAQ